MKPIEIIIIFVILAGAMAALHLLHVWPFNIETTP